MERARSVWPWALGALLSGMYFYQPEPFEEVGASTLTLIRRPILRGTEWLEVRDVDPEAMVLELPPDMHFGPLPIKQQMDFLLQALKDDNELADGYVTRIIIDHFDMSLDPPPMGDLLAQNRGKELLDFAVADFTDQRHPRKNTFFNGDQFLRLINVMSNQQELQNHFLHKCQGIPLMFRALQESTEEYARVLTARSLTLFALMQPEDGFVEKQLLAGGYGPKLVDLYRQCTGDATDTRYVTMLISSIIRHYPEAAAKEFGPQLINATVDNINIARYKGLPQHYRILKDLKRLPPDVQKKAGINVTKQLADHDFISVASGVIDSYPEYSESTASILELFNDLRSVVKPMEFVEYRVLSSMAKALQRQELNTDFYRPDGTMHEVLKFCNAIAADKEVKPFLTSGPDNLQHAWKVIESYNKKFSAEFEKQAQKAAEEAAKKAMPAAAA